MQIQSGPYSGVVSKIQNVYNGIIVWEIQFTIHNNVLCTFANPKIMFF